MPSTTIVRSLSVVTPCYHELNTVLLCVEAVLKSEYIAELIIVDDGSGDGTRDQHASISNPCLRVILHDENSGNVDAHRVFLFWHSVGTKILTLVSNMFTNLNLTDMEKNYKERLSKVYDCKKIDLILHLSYLGRSHLSAGRFTR